MKKWLVGLVAAGLCAASAWAVQYTLITSATEVTEGNYVIVAGQGDSAMKNVGDTKGRISAEAVTVTDGVITDPDASLVWTLTSDGDEWIISSETSAGTVYAAAPSSPENSSRLLSALADTFTLWTITNSATADLITVGSYEYLDRFLQKNNTGPFFACYKTTSNQKDVRFFKEGSDEFSVEIVPSDEFSKTESGEFELTEGTEFAHLTAVAKNGESPYTFSWTGATWAGDYVELEGETLDIPADLAEGEYYVTVWATDSSEPPQTKEESFTFTVVPAPQAYTVTVADGIENGSVAVWDGETELVSPADVLEGTVLTVVATPATRSYKVESVSVTGETSGDAIALTDGEFEMPAEDVLVTATFMKREGTAYALVESMDGFEAGADYLIVAHKDGSYSSALKSAYQSESDGRIAVEEVEIDGDTVETDDASIVWRIAAGAEGKYTLYNAAAAKYVSAPSSASQNAALLVTEGDVAATQWTIAFTNGDAKATIGSIYEGKSLQRNSNENNKYFANYTGGAKPYLFKKDAPGEFTLVLDPADDFVVTNGTAATITAEAKNAQGEVTYKWNVTDDGTPGSGEGNVWTIPADAPIGGPWTVYCNANDGTSEDDQWVSFSVVAAPVIYDVTIADNIENGTVDVDPAFGVAGTPITVTATPDEGYTLADIFVNGERIEGNTFELPEGGATVSATFDVSAAKAAMYTVESTNSVSVTGTVPAGSEAVYASTYTSKYQLTADQSMTLTLKGYDGCTITGLTLSMKSNTGSGSGSLSATCGDAIIGSIADAAFSAGSWNGSYSTNYVDIHVPVTPTVVDGDVVITLKASVKSLYCQSFTVEYEPGTPTFGITLEPGEDFTVVEGEAKSIEATPKNAVGEVTYAWTVDGVDANTTGNLLPLDTGMASETPHVVVCTATDAGAEGATAEASVSYTVVAAPALFTVRVADGIENGTVALSAGGEPVAPPAELAVGTEVTVEATPADGYELEAITVNGELLEGTTTFTVTGNSEVSATFAKIKDYATLPFLAEGTPFTGPWQTPKEAGVTVEGLGTDYNNTIDGRGAKFDTTGDWLQIKFEGTPGELSYGLKGNGTSSEQVSTFDVAESATGEDGTWTPVASHKSGENLFNNVKTNFTAELKADSRFVKFAYTERVAGNVGLFDVYISSGGFSVGFVGKEDGFTVDEGTADSITAEAVRGVEPYSYVWTSATPALNGTGETLVIPDTLGAAETPYSVTVTATDSSEPPQTDSATITFTVVEAPPPPEMFTVDVADGILNGTIALFVDGDELAVPAEVAEGTVVTVVATPYDGYKAGEISVNITNVLESDSFTVTEDATVYASFVESHDVRYVPVKSADEFVAGEEYLIVAHKAGTFTDAMKNAADDKGTHIGVAGVSMDADGSISTDNAAIVWKIQAAKEEGQYVLFNEVGNVYAAATKNDNVAQLLAEGTNALAQWTLDLTGLPSVKIVSVSYPNRWLQRNTTSNLQYFATYTGTQTTPLLYKKAGPTVFDVTVNKTGFEVPLGSADAVTASAKNGVEPYSYVWTSETEELNGAGALLEIPATLAAGEYTATVTATDSSEPPQTDTAEVAFTVAAPAVKYAVTVDQEIANGTIAADKDEAEAGETVTLTATPADGWKLGTFTLNGVPFAGDSFEMPEGGALVSAEFVQIVKYPITVDGEIANGSIAADKDEAEAGETVTLTATPADGWKLGTFILNGLPFGGNTFEMPEGEALVSAEFVERTMTTYELVEDADDFVAGEEYLIVAHSGDSFTSAMKNEANGDRIGLDEVEFKTETTIETDNDAIVWVIQAGKGEGQYTLFNAAGVYAAAKSDGNTAQIVTDGTNDLAQWKLDLTGLPAAKIVSASYTNRWLQRNSTPNNKYFATYTGSQTTPSLYKKAGFSVGFVDKEDGFTVDEGTADSITAEAVRGVEPYSYVWTSETPALNGTGETLVIPDTLGAAETPYSVTVTATDSSEPPQTASKTITFEVVPPVVRFEVTVAEGIVGGEVAVDKALAEPGEEVTVTATPADGHELVAITVSHGDEVLEFDASPATFQMPVADVTVSATFREVVDYATLPFVSLHTPYSGPWYNADLPVGMTSGGLGGDYSDKSAKFNDTGDWIQVKFAGTPGKLSYWIKGNSVAATDEKTPEFTVQESADGLTWADVAVYQGAEALDIDTKAEHELSEDSRFVRFVYTEKAQGNVGINDIYIGVPGEEEPYVTVTGETTVRVGGLFQLVLGLENYEGAFTWTNNVLFGSINAEDSTYYWNADKIGSYDVTFMAMDGKRVIASTNVTLTVRGIPALVIEGAPEGVIGEPVTCTVVAENMADPTVTFLGFLEVPEGSSLSDSDVDFDPETGKATFTPDVTGDYGLGFCAGTGDDHVEDLWIVTVTEKPEPDVVFSGDETGTTGQAVRFYVAAALPGGSVDFDEYIWNFPDESSLTDENVSIDTETGEVTFTPDVPGEYEFGFALVGSRTPFYRTITVDGEAEPPRITKVEVYTESGLVILWYTGDGAEVWGTDDLTEETDTWAPVEALFDKGEKSALVEMGKKFLRVQ